ncbi:LA_0442/LA_0875 N-terminal domain-containing protein [Leptospira sarikeiensis]|uniref:Uncharacterized protein n=1 Tax=Leptospira sarikeiensis TaxID=2484943 RepID=A0A4R9K9N2_9LEPT|nr:cell envelope integrity protein TolA [Leptospira sarikeiensis]TGL63388.1 hypothetical protein EHQ64_05375 [Leptospira sarikeiensis]
MQKVKNEFQTILVFGLLLFFVTSLYSNEQVIYLKDGKVLTAEIISQTAFKMVVKLSDGTTREISKQDIKKVAFKEVKTPDQKDKNPVVPPTPTPEELAQKEEEAKKQQIADEKAEKRKKQIEEAKRNRLDVFLGLGSSNLNFQGGNFYDQVIAIGSSLGQEGGKFELPTEPKPKGGKASVVEVRYSWNRYVGEIGGQSLTSSSNVQVVGTDGPSNSTFPKIVQGSYDVSMKHIYGNFSYSVFPHPKHDIRPVIGYHQFWTKTEDRNPFTFGAGSASSSFSDQYFGVIPTSVAEVLKGYSYGVQYDVKLGKFEIRTGLHILQLHGFGTYSRTEYTYAPGNGDGQTNGIEVYNKWVAKGAILDLKFLYSWNYGVSFWLGLNSMSWKYTFSDTSLTIKNEDSANEDPVQNLVLGKALFESLVGPGALKETQATTFLIGATYSYDFNK